MAELDGKEFVHTIDHASDIRTQRLAEVAAVYAECITNIYKEPDKRTINEHQGKTKDYNTNYLLYLFVSYFSYSVTQFNERTLVVEFETRRAQ